MHIQNLEDGYHELLDFLEANHYSTSYIQKFRTIIRRIQKLQKGNDGDHTKTSILNTLKRKFIITSLNIHDAMF